MVVPEATRNTIRLKPLMRSRYDFTSSARSVLRNETAESFVGLNILDSAGFLLRAVLEYTWRYGGIMLCIVHR